MRVAQVAIALAVLGALTAGYLGIRADRHHHEAASVGEVLAVPDGELRVDAVRYWNESQHMKGMPGMKIPDPLPAGYRRFWVDVTMHSTGGAGLPYSPDAFTVSGPGLAPVVPHWSSDGLDRVRPGAQVTETLLFQVPAARRNVLLHLPGAARAVVIPGPGSRAGAHHGT